MMSIPVIKYTFFAVRYNVGALILVVVKIMPIGPNIVSTQTGRNARTPRVSGDHHVRNV